MPPCTEACPDCIVWKWSDKGGFSSSKSYKNLFTQSDGYSSIWRMIWRLCAPQRVRVFFWLLWHVKILTNVERKRRHMTEDATCPLCASSIESIVHALHNCSFASNIWKTVLPTQVHSLFFSFSFHDWLYWNLQDKGGLNTNEVEWQSLFMILCWLI